MIPQHTALASRARADELNPRARALLYAILLIASLSYNFSFIIIDYIRPFLVRDLGMSLYSTALLYTAQGAGVLIGSFAAAPLVSGWGSRNALILASLCMAAVTFATLFATSFGAWAALRFCVGITLAASYISTTTMLANFFAPKMRARLLSVNGAMFSVALLITGSIGALIGDNGWRVLLELGAGSPVAVALLAKLTLPDDRKFCVYADANVASDENVTRGTWKDMFAGRRRWLTIACLLLAGLNFSGYQFYSGFITTYLINVRHWAASLAGLFLTIDGLGTLLGSILWGWVADRIGRRANAIGFALTSVFIAGFLIAPQSTPLLCALEFGYAVCLSATNCWGAYFAELFAVRLRPMGTALFSRRPRDFAGGTFDRSHGRPLPLPRRRDGARAGNVSHRFNTLVVASGNLASKSAVQRIHRREVTYCEWRYPISVRD